MTLLSDYLLDLAVVLVLLAAFWQFRTPPGARRGNITAAAASENIFREVLVGARRCALMKKEHGNRIRNALVERKLWVRVVKID